MGVLQTPALPLGYHAGFTVECSHDAGAVNLAYSLPVLDRYVKCVDRYEYACSEGECTRICQRFGAGNGN